MVNLPIKGGLRNGGMKISFWNDKWMEQDTQSMYFQRSKLNVNNKHLCLKYGQENDGISIYEDNN